MSANAPVVTVIVPTYNGRDTLVHTLRSLLAQDFDDFEAWIVGDGCTDGSEEVVAEFNDARLHWINLPQNTGSQWRPNNEGLAHARGRYIAFLGHDDLWLPWHLSTLVFHAGKSGTDFLHDILVNIGPDGVLDVNGPPPRGTTYERYFCPPSSWLHRREVVAKVGPWRNPRELTWGTDYDYLRRVHLAGLRIEFVPSFGVVKFPALRWRAYSKTAPRPQAAALEMMLQDPVAFSVRILTESAVAFSSFTFQGARQPLKQAWRDAAAAGAHALKVLVRAIIDAYGRDRWPLRPLLRKRMRRILGRNRVARGLPLVPNIK
jgi:glycosyltransferase involved in cell wall biosynthesis